MSFPPTFVFRPIPLPLSSAATFSRIFVAWRSTPLSSRATFLRVFVAWREVKDTFEKYRMKQKPYLCLSDK